MAGKLNVKSINLTVTLASIIFRISLQSVPKCTSVCLVDAPEAEIGSDLELIGLKPAATKKLTSFADYAATGKPIFDGDHLVYQCMTDFWGVNGGIDTVHDVFQCAADGYYNTPLGSNFEQPWPACAPQHGSKSFWLK